MLNLGGKRSKHWVRDHERNLVPAGLSPLAPTTLHSRDIVDTWLLALEDDAGVAKDDRRAMTAAVEDLIETRLAETAKNARIGHWA